MVSLSLSRDSGSHPPAINSLLPLTGVFRSGGGFSGFAPWYDGSTDQYSCKTPINSQICGSDRRCRVGTPRRRFKPNSGNGTSAQGCGERGHKLHPFSGENGSPGTVSTPQSRRTAAVRGTFSVKREKCRLAGGEAVRLTINRWRSDWVTFLPIFRVFLVSGRSSRSHRFACVPIKPAYYRGTVMGTKRFGGCPRSSATH